MHSLNGYWRSLVARALREREAIGSNPIYPTYLQWKRKPRFGLPVAVSKTVGGNTRGGSRPPASAERR